MNDKYQSGQVTTTPYVRTDDGRTVSVNHSDDTLPAQMRPGQRAGNPFIDHSNRENDIGEVVEKLTKGVPPPPPMPTYTPKKEHKGVPPPPPMPER